ncbi:hypothetical protein [Bifidobacterium sp.]|jgi:ABC-type glycerol-3-phosphate transport system substrate-binding protein|uniref:hypothetical protein n=1 Tax=Bifidobacterium sp. TaxID=41200 RepID=UPI0025C4456D|nr:hypothetical protein [Bifidobacterium sp.]MCI1634618.1 hypothetical protein [Bifidobacterium sp.]
MRGHNNRQTPLSSNEAYSAAHSAQSPKKINEAHNATTNATSALMPQKLTRGSRLSILCSLPQHQRWNYFKDQLLKRCLVALAAVFTASFLLIHILTPAPAPKLYVAIINNALDTSQSKQLQQISAKALKLPQGRTGGITVSSHFDLTNDGLSKLQTMISSQEIDIVIADNARFSQLSGYGYFVSLPSLSQMKSTSTHLSDNFMTFHGYDDSEHADAFYDGSGKGAKHKYGLNITQFAQWRKLATENNQAVLGITQNTRNPEEAREFIEFLDSA